MREAEDDDKGRKVGYQGLYAYLVKCVSKEEVVRNEDIRDESSQAAWRSHSTRYTTTNRSKVRSGTGK
jgi:hypothetical protein